MRRVEVAIIGAGSAGLSARTEVSRQTDSYVLIDDGPLGTTCARVGCMPSKALIQVAHDFHRRGVFAREGIRGGEGLQIDDAAVMTHVRALRDRFVGGVLRGMRRWEETHLVRGRARFVARDRLEVRTAGGREEIQARAIIVATGSSPIIPEAWRGLSGRLLDTDGFFELERLPGSIALVGLGVVGLELGQALSRLGVRVQAFTLDKALGGLSDPAVQERAFDLISAELPVTLGAVEALEERDGALLVRAAGEEHLVERAFVAMGRRPNLAGLGLEDLGLPMDGRGRPVYEPGTFRLGDAEIYLVGDVNGRRPLLHEASDQGRIAGHNAARGTRQRFEERTALAITFSDPNIAVVGAGHGALIDEGVDFVTGACDFEGLGRAIIKQESRGLVHVHAAREGGRLLGAELVAPNGEHLAHLLAWAVGAGLTARQALGLPFYHPVLEEGLRTALRGAARRASGPREPLETPRVRGTAAG